MVRTPTAIPPDVAAWRNRHPLKRWIDRQRFGHAPMLGAAEALGVRRQQVFNWLTGFSVPSLANFSSITKATSITSAQWLGWLSKAPAGARRERPSKRTTTKEA